jgi:hypothetical protein
MTNEENRIIKLLNEKLEKHNVIMKKEDIKVIIKLLERKREKENEIIFNNSSG